MSTYEAAYKSLLQGVSQQLPEERLPGQLTAQVNMLSDPVTNLRRRPGVLFRDAWPWPGSSALQTMAWFTDLAGSRVHIVLNTNTGNIRILSENYVEEASLDAGAYLTNSNISRIRATTVGNDFFLANCDVKPTLTYTPGLPDPAKAGFFYVVAGAFGKTFTVSVTHSGVGTATVSYTTPGGTGGGDAALATPEYIAGQLHSQLASIGGWVNLDIDGPYVFIRAANNLTVSTNVGSNYLIASKNGFVDTVGDLPSRLPSTGNGYIARVGTGASPQYYQYDNTETRWLEVGVYGSPTGITGIPISIGWNGTAWELNTSQFQGRLAGDDSSNPPHEFMQYGLTGMSTFQGRLVLMSGPLVSLSASGAPRTFFRTTASNLVNSDAIEIGSGMNSAAAYEHAIPFQKDLLLFSRAYQAVLPSGNSALTPANATVVPTSAHEMDTTCPPIALGRTLMYCNPRSEDFFGVLEMVPSNYTDSQYISQDSTPHLPKYMGGRCRFAVSSGVASMALFAPSGDPYTLIVHEYHWDGDTKVQQAWHQWTFEYPVATAYFASDVIVLGFVQNNRIVLGTVDPRAGAVNAASQRRPFLDLNIPVSIVANKITVPAWMVAFDPGIAVKLKAAALTGGLAGDLVGSSATAADELTTVTSYPSGTVGIGIPYYSGYIPGPPVVRDYKDAVIHSGKATLVRYLLGTRNSQEYKVKVSDAYTTEEDGPMGTLTMSSPEFELGRGLYADTATAIIPCRTDMRTTQMEVSTEGTGELNTTSLEYVAKYHPKIKRR